MRKIGSGGSASSRRTSAMSASRMIRSPTAKLTARMSFSDLKAPLTRSLMVSASVVMTPDGTHDVLRLQRRHQASRR